tara:strand:+ start:2258 stop:2821 length:564 start_codon:yes stop_codon:yes gene_type:complete
MRIISGNFKGKKILRPKDNTTRPLKDLTKESIFNIINHSNELLIDLKKAEVLDLFAGTGSFGLECLSREAKHVTFVENYDKILPVLKKNLDNLKSLKNYKVIEQDIFKLFIRKILKNSFDIIFLDPPYKETKLLELIYLIHNNKILTKNGIVIIHRHKKEKNIFPKEFKILNEKIYGISKIIFGNFH